MVVKAWRPGRYPISRGLQTPVMMGPSPSNNIWMLEEIGSKGRAAWKVSNLKRAPVMMGPSPNIPTKKKGVTHSTPTREELQCCVTTQVTHSTHSTPTKKEERREAMLCDCTTPYLAADRS